MYISPGLNPVARLNNYPVPIMAIRFESSCIRVCTGYPKFCFYGYKQPVT